VQLQSTHRRRDAIVCVNAARTPRRQQDCDVWTSCAQEREELHRIGGDLWRFTSIRTLEVFRLDDETWRMLKTWHGDVTVNAKPFDAVALDLAALWERLLPLYPESDASATVPASLSGAPPHCAPMNCSAAGSNDVGSPDKSVPSMPSHVPRAV
jgi:hypothetical protein